MGEGKSERSHEREEKRGGMTGAAEQEGMSRVPRRGRLNGHLDEDRTEEKRNRVKGGKITERREREQRTSVKG